MLQEEIKPDLCYLHQVGGKFGVRKVISIISDRVIYQFMSGPVLRSGKKFNECALKNFANWATSQIEEKSDYSYLNGFVIEKNYTVLSVHGYELLKCQEKKVKVYLRNEMLKWVDENTLQFTTDEIENKLLFHHGGKMPEYMLVEKNTHCVVCEKNTHLTKHHVVPKKDLPHYPSIVKKDFCNLLTLCRKCHTDYEIIKEKDNVSFEGYTYATAVKWMEHFVETMNPKFLPRGWHILTGLGKIRFGI